MTLDKYIKILEDIRDKEGGGLEVSRVVIGRKIEPAPRLSVVKFDSDKATSFKRWDPTYEDEKKILIV